MMSKIERATSPINLPLMKPAWAFKLELRWITLICVISYIKTNCTISISTWVLGYQSVSGFKNIRNIFPVTLHDLWFDNMARSEMQVFSFSILWSCIVGLFWNVHCIGKVVLKNKFNFTSAVIRSIDLLVGFSFSMFSFHMEASRLQDYNIVSK